MVVSGTDKSLHVVRITDNKPKLVHKDQVRKLRPNHELCADLPESVRQIIGGDLSPATLKRLAEEDSLEQIYKDEFQPVVELRKTRLKTQAEKAEEEDEAKNSIIDNNDGLQAWEADLHNLPNRAVRFNV